MLIVYLAFFKDFHFSKYHKTPVMPLFKTTLICHYVKILNLNEINITTVKKQCQANCCLKNYTLYVHARTAAMN